MLEGFHKVQLLLETYGFVPHIRLPAPSTCAGNGAYKVPGFKNQQGLCPDTRGVGNGHSSPKGLVHRTRGLTDVAARTKSKSGSLRSTQTTCEGDPSSERGKRPLGLSPETETTG